MNNSSWSHWSLEQTQLHQPAGSQRPLRSAWKYFLNVPYLLDSQAHILKQIQK